MNPTRLIILLAVLNACSHDTDRENPLDPALTPGVVLTAAVSDTGGAVSLEWTRYAGVVPILVETAQAPIVDIDA